MKQTRPLFRCEVIVTLMKKLPLSFILLLFPVLANATVYYVANAGNDSCNGISSSLGKSGACAWRTIAHVNARTFEPGDSVLFNKGDTWREQLIVPSSGASGHPITFGAYGSGAQPIITAYNSISSWTLYSGTIYYATATTRPSRVWNGSTELANNAGRYASLNNNQWDWNSGRIYTNIGSNPTTHDIEADQRTYSIGTSVTITDITIQNLSLLGNSGATYATVYFDTLNSHRISVLNCTIGKSGGHGIELRGSNCVVVGNIITDTMGNGIHADCRTQTGEVFSYNAISNNGSGGAIEITASNSEVSYNTLFDRKSNGTNCTVPHHGVYEYYDYPGGIGNTFEHNEIYGFSNSAYGDSGFRLSGNNNILRYNKFHDNYYAMYDIDAEGSNTGNQIYYNLFYNNAHPILEIDGAQNNSFYNNVLDSVLEFGPGTHQTCSGNIVKNNIWSGVFYGVIAVAAGQGTGFVSNYNTFYPASGNLFIWLGAVKSFSSWRSSSGQDANTLTSNPLFVSTSTPNFTLQTGSPAIYAGVNVGLTTDYAGIKCIIRRRSGLMNMGKQVQRLLKT